MSNRMASSVRFFLTAGRQTATPSKNTAPENRSTVQRLYTGSSVSPINAALPSGAMLLGDVNRCVEILSDDMAKLPWFMMDGETRERTYDGGLLYLLRVRPNEAMTPFTVDKLLEASVDLSGNGYLWIIRSPKSLKPVELIPVPPQLVTPWKNQRGEVWYRVIHPYSNEPITVNAADMIHLKGFSTNGLTGIGVLERARQVIEGGYAAQEYQKAFYEHGGQPSGILQTESDLGGYSQITGPDGNPLTNRDVVRNEWERVHSGAGNAHRVAILDLGLKYSPIAVSQKDAQFVESAALRRVDIANFFGVPLYKLNDGKQAYDSNDQNNTDYAMSTLQPKVTQWEQEFTYKLLTGSEIHSGLRLRKNMMAALRGDSTSRGAWYRTMREIGAFSVNDILALEDMPDVSGGDTRNANLNFVPLEDFKRLSEHRNGEKTK